MACCGSIEWDDEKPDGECPECGTETFQGQAYESCSYSPVACETCGWQPCDLSC